MLQQQKLCYDSDSVQLLQIVVATWSLCCDNISALVPNFLLQLHFDLAT